MSYRISGLSPQLFQPLWALADPALAARDVRRVVADSDRGFPCRISLQNAHAGETLLLLPFEHHAVASPYRASGPIFIRENAGQAAEHEGAVPSSFLHRLLSVRAYGSDAMMRLAEVVEGTQLDAMIRACFQHEDVAYLHIHNARHGCFAAAVERAYPESPGSRGRSPRMMRAPRW